MLFFGGGGGVVAYDTLHNIVSLCLISDVCTLNISNHKYTHFCKRLGKRIVTLVMGLTPFKQ